MCKDITISIVLYKHSLQEIEKLVMECCRINELNSDILIIDNSSDISLKTEINSKYSKVNYILSSNIGFGAAHNIAIKYSLESGSKYHLVINPDIELKKTDILALFEYMEQNENIGNVMPKITYPDGSTQTLCKLLPTPTNLFLRRFFPGFLTKVHTQKYELREFGYDKIKDIPSLSGCFMFLRTNVLREVGGFDERFFMYMEDVDLCRRIGEKFRVVFQPNVEIIHRYEKGSYYNLKLLKIHLLSAFKYFNKWGWLIDGYRVKVNKITLASLNNIK